jgi:hypothetical protein
MIAFGSAITDPTMYENACGPGIARAKEADSVVLARAAAGSIYRSYNMVMDQAAELEGLEALVMLHQDAEIVDTDFCRKVRESLRDPEVGVVGCVGAVGVRSIAWWDGAVTWASFTHRYSEFGGGAFEAFGWEGAQKPPYAEIGEVDTVDGFVMVFSPWVVQNLRFDESLGQLHGYDFDFCLTVREAGKKVVTQDLQLVHHHSLDLVSNPDTWVEAHMRIAEKWEDRMPQVGAGPDDWKARARRAEAEAAVWRTIARAEEMKRHAAVEEVTSSVSWRVTKPLRALNRIRRSVPDPDQARATTS